mgnify:CR=1 FL=1
MADVKLLPLPDVLALMPQPIRDAARAYARANMEPLRAEVAELRRLLWLAVRSQGDRVWIERREAEAFDQGRAQVTFELCPENDCYLVRASTIQEDRNG